MSEAFRRAMALSGGLPKPEPKKRERQQKRRAVIQGEVAEKHAVRARDGNRCRWPGCLWPSGYVEVAHLQHKGMGGDKQGLRTQRRKMICLCAWHHRGQRSLDSKHLRIIPLDEQLGTDGCCEFVAQRAGEDVYCVEQQPGFAVLTYYKKKE